MTERMCLNCGMPLTSRAFRCPSCREKHVIEVARLEEELRVMRNRRFCADCGKTIGPRVLRCEGCQTHVEQMRLVKVSEHRKKDDFWKRNTLQRKYGMTLPEWNSLFSQQNNSCAICGTKDPGRKDGFWCVDHDHTTGKVRGILCNGCNMGLGNFKDHEDNMVSAIAYLQVSSARLSDGRSLTDWV